MGGILYYFFPFPQGVLVGAAGGSRSPMEPRRESARRSTATACEGLRVGQGRARGGKKGGGGGCVSPDHLPVP